MTRLLVVIFLFLPAFCASAEIDAASDSSEHELVVFLVRHAEKITGAGEDPGLTAEGTARAGRLAALMKSARIDFIHSSDYERTRKTVEPLVNETGVKAEIYDPRDLPSLATEIRSMPGRHLVSGHSNTTPALVSILGGEPGDPIDEATEFDRLYILSFTEEGKVSTVLLRY